MLPGVYPSNNHIYRTTVQFRLVEVTMMHTAVTVAANSLDAHESPGRQSLEDIQGPSEASPGLVSPIAWDAIRGPGLVSRAALDVIWGLRLVSEAALDAIRGPRLVSGAALDAIWGPGPASGARVWGPGPKARQPYWILEPLQKFYKQFLKIPAFSMQKQYSQRSTQC